MPYKDKEKYKEYIKEYRQNNKEKIKEQRKEWYENNKEKVKEYNEKNKEKITERHKEYRQSENGKRSNTIKNWKFHGLKCDDYDELYDKYIIAEFCEECEVKFEGNGKNQRCMDHEHSTGLFRNFLCKSCNSKRQ